MLARVSPTLHAGNWFIFRDRGGSPLCPYFYRLAHTRSFFSGYSSSGLSKYDLVIEKRVWHAVRPYFHPRNLIWINPLFTALLPHTWRGLLERNFLPFFIAKGSLAKSMTRDSCEISSFTSVGFHEIWAVLLSHSERDKIATVIGGK